MATIEAIGIENVATALNQLRLMFSALGSDNSSVGIAKMPVYHSRHSLLSESDPGAASAAMSWSPTAKIANKIVPALKSSRPMAPNRM